MLTSVDRLLFIRSVPIFKELRDDFLVRLASVMDEVAFAASHTIITEGHEGAPSTLWCRGECRCTCGARS